MDDTATTERLYFIDWLRIIAVALLVPFHTGMMFTFWGFHIKNDTSSLIIHLQNAFMNTWHMPLFFFLSGASVWFALRFRRAREYIKERQLRLMVPLTFGILVIIPPQVYIERLFRFQFQGSFFQFYPHIFNGIYPTGNLSWHHLWFLFYLFLYSLLALPLFLHLRSNNGHIIHKKISDFFSKPLTVYLLVIPFIIVQIAVGRSWPNGDQNLIGDLDNFFLHMLVFIYGYFFCFNTNFWKTVQNNLWINIIGGVICFSLGVYIYETSAEGYLESHPISGAGMLALHGVVFWFWLLTILGLGKIFLNFSNRLLKYATEAALPFYIIHQTIIIIIGFFIIRSPIGIFPKYFTIMMSSFICTLLVYDLLVKRLQVLRFLFGMRPKA
jgi:hypothetical protein